MMKLLAIRSLDTQDPPGGLGPKVEHRPVVAPKKETRLPWNPQIVVRPDGKWETAIPENKAAAQAPPKAVSAEGGTICISNGGLQEILCGRRPITPVDLTEESLEEVILEMMDFSKTHGAAISFLPTQVVIPVVQTLQAQGPRRPLLPGRWWKE